MSIVTFVDITCKLGLHSFDHNCAFDVFLVRKIMSTGITPKQVANFSVSNAFARFFMSVPASSAPQERQFSGLKRWSAGPRNNTKIEQLDMYAVLSTRKDSDDYSKVSLFFGCNGHQLVLVI